METRKVAILGGARIPFCRSGTAYKDEGRGLISVCTAGGMGVAAVLERG